MLVWTCRTAVIGDQRDQQRLVFAVRSKCFFEGPNKLAIDEFGQKDFLVLLNILTEGPKWVCADIYRRMVIFVGTVEQTVSIPILYPIGSHDVAILG